MLPTPTSQCLQPDPRRWASWGLRPYLIHSYGLQIPELWRIQSFVHVSIQKYIYWALTKGQDLCPTVVKYLRYGRGKGKIKGKNISKGDSWVHSGAEKGRVGESLQEKSLPGSGFAALHVITSLGFSFYTTFQRSLDNFSTGNFESFANWANHVPDHSFHLRDISAIWVEIPLGGMAFFLRSNLRRLTHEVRFSDVWIWVLAVCKALMCQMLTGWLGHVLVRIWNEKPSGSTPH